MAGRNKRATRHICNAASCNAKTNVVQHRQVESGSLLAPTNEQADDGSDISVALAAS